MNKPRYSIFQSLIHKFASSLTGAWAFSRVLPPADRLVFRISGGRKTLSSMWAGVPVVILTTMGARSGLPRTYPVLCIRIEPGAEAFAIIASNWGQAHNPSWYYNLRSRPRAVCTINGQTGEYLAQEAVGAKYDLYWQCAAEIYPGFQLYKQRAAKRHIPIMVMKPASANRE